MARKCSYSKRDLQIACSKTKIKIQNDIELKKITKLMATKSYIYSEVGKRLKLKDTSAFYKKNYQYYEYLNTWFEGLSKDIKEYLDNNKDTTTNIVNISTSDNNANADATITSNDEFENLRLQLREKDLLIKHLNSVITELRMENESLRLQRIRRLHHLDTNKGSDILDESMSSEDVKSLYNLINKLYDATFNN